MIAVNVIIQDIVKNSKISAWVLLPLVHTSIAKEMPLQLSPRACTLEGDRGAWSPPCFQARKAPWYRTGCWISQTASTTQWTYVNISWFGTGRTDPCRFEFQVLATTARAPKPVRCNFEDCNWITKQCFSGFLPPHLLQSINSDHSKRVEAVDEWPRLPAQQVPVLAGLYTSKDCSIACATRWGWPSEGWVVSEVLPCSTQLTYSYSNVGLLVNGGALLICFDFSGSLPSATCRHREWREQELATVCSFAACFSQ